MEELRRQANNSWAAVPTKAAAPRASASWHRLRPNDIVIAVMGVTGSGKSTFVQHFSEEAKVGDSLESCTTKTEAYRCVLPDGQVIYLVDTPGFDDTYSNDVDILSEVADWLNKTYKRSVLLAGIVYLHRIQDPRMGGSGVRNLRMFKKLCGDDNLGGVVLATTMWSRLGNAEMEKGLAREKELMSRPDFWKGMIDKGSQVFRQDRGRESALEIVRYLIERKRRMRLDLQKDMVDKGLHLDQTSAGREVEAEQTKHRENFELRRRRAIEMLEHGLKDCDPEVQRAAKEKYRQEVQKMIDENQAALTKLRSEKFRDEEKLRQEQALKARDREAQREAEEYRQEVQKKIDENQAALTKLRIEKFRDREELLRQVNQMRQKDANQMAERVRAEEARLTAQIQEIEAANARALKQQRERDAELAKIQQEQQAQREIQALFREAQTLRNAQERRERAEQLAPCSAPFSHAPSSH